MSVNRSYKDRPSTSDVLSESGASRPCDGGQFVADDRDLVYDLRRLAAGLHRDAERIEAQAWELNRTLRLRRTRG